MACLCLRFVGRDKEDVRAETQMAAYYDIARVVGMAALNRFRHTPSGGSRQEQVEGVLGTCSCWRLFMACLSLRNERRVLGGVPLSCAGSNTGVVWL